ncbi:MAG: hypothetical protein V3W44_09795 [Dehalococcoidales bacterium]
MTWNTAWTYEIANHQTAVAQGIVPNATPVEKFGKNDAIGSSLETIWDGGGIYNYPAADNVSLSISSDTAADTSREYTVIGLDTDFVRQTEIVTTDATDAQTETAVDGTWSRVYRVYNSGATSAAGAVYVYDASSDVVAGVPSDAAKIHATVMTLQQQTLMCVYTIPATETGYLYNLYVIGTTPVAAVTHIQLAVREFGGVFRALHDVSVTQGAEWQHEFHLPLSLPSKSDVELRCSASTGSRVFSGGFSIMCQAPPN